MSIDIKKTIWVMVTEIVVVIVASIFGGGKLLFVSMMFSKMKC